MTGPLTDADLAAEVFPLSAYLAEEMIERGWNAADVADRMPGDYPINVAVMNIVLALSVEQASRMVITDDLATCIGVAFGVSGQYIKNLHQVFLDNPTARRAYECPESLFAGLWFPSHAENENEP